MKKIFFLFLATALHCFGQTITPPSSLPTVTGTVTVPYYVVLGSDNVLHIESVAQMQSQAQSGVVLSGSINGTVLTALGNTANASGGILTFAGIGATVQAPVTLTTAGAGGAATFISNTLNIPAYQPPIALVTASGTNTYVATPSPALGSYTTGLVMNVTFANANTGGASLNLNSLGAVPIHQNGLALISGQIPGGATICLVYDGTNFDIVGNDSGGVTFSTGLTEAAGVVTVNVSQAITTLSTLTANGLVTTSAGTGTLSITVPGTNVLSDLGNAVDGSGGLASHTALLALTPAKATGTLSSGAVTIANGAITTSSEVVAVHTDSSATNAGALFVKALSAGSVTIDSTNGSDNDGIVILIWNL